MAQTAEIYDLSDAFLREQKLRDTHDELNGSPNIVKSDIIRLLNLMDGPKHDLFVAEVKDVLSNRRISSEGSLSKAAEDLSTRIKARQKAGNMSERQAECLILEITGIAAQLTELERNQGIDSQPEDLNYFRAVER